MTHAVHTPLEITLEDFAYNTKRFFKILGLRFANFAEAVGSSRAAGELAGIGRHQAAQAVMENFRNSSQARSRLIRQLK